MGAGQLLDDIGQQGDKEIHRQQDERIQAGEEPTQRAIGQLRAPRQDHIQAIGGLHEPEGGFFVIGLGLLFFDKPLQVGIHGVHKGFEDRILRPSLEGRAQTHLPGSPPGEGLMGQAGQEQTQGIRVLALVSELYAALIARPEREPVGHLLGMPDVNPIGIRLLHR